MSIYISWNGLDEVNLKAGIEWIEYIYISWNGLDEVYLKAGIEWIEYIYKLEWIGRGIPKGWNDVD